MNDGRLTPSLVRPERFELGISMKRVLDEFMDVFVDNIVRDVTHLFTDDLRVGQKSSEDVGFRADGDEETKIGRKWVSDDFFEITRRSCW